LSHYDEAVHGSRDLHDCRLSVWSFLMMAVVNKVISCSSSKKRISGLTAGRINSEKSAHD
jgi:hypothetical protein